ncbi:protein PhnA [Winogradskyella wandonensis]|uniref:Protein PhnA n=1 Tax=Winogradskyella wandonensis TaxID=1442586 RepID=A0A4V2PT52_9FLAO|nr:alkylphosphonate utilization protein [Winogradskyella wandonensis]TCK65181.1 protein PhnA [Winogradskyella wandonensis]
MTSAKDLKQRSNNQCELCSATEDLSVYDIPNAKEKVIYACNNCIAQMEDSEKIDPNHWRCLNDSMWSEYDAVKIMAWRMLNRVNQPWAEDMLAMMYLEDETLELAKAAGDGEADENQIIHRDVNGVVLDTGDSVVLVKDLKVKGSSMVAKQGTAVRNIRLDRENSEYIEGKVDGQHIVIITKYVKKL